MWLRWIIQPAGQPAAIFAMRRPFFQPPSFFAFRVTPSFAFLCQKTRLSLGSAGGHGFAFLMKSAPSCHLAAGRSIVSRTI